MILFYIVLVILTLILLYMIVVLVIYLFCFTNLTKTNRVINEKNNYYPYLESIKESEELFEKVNKESVEIESDDQLTLRGYFIENEIKDKVVIIFHGYKSKGSFALTYNYYALGYSILLIDQRAHGRSDGCFIGMGILERFDALKWIEYVINRFGENTSILLSGTSMGGATIMMASELITYPQVKGIIADCGFSSCYEQIKSCIRGFPKHPTMELVNLYSRLFAKYDMKEITSAESLSNSNIPLLLIHGKKDDFVPYSNLKICYDASKSEIKDYLYVDKAIHATACVDGKDEYDLKVKKFLKDISF